MNSFRSAEPSRRRLGFTLIELLTVIAIIGILAAIIIPTVGKVRASARKSQSASNLRQIGIGTQLYTQDNKGLLPASNSVENNPAGGTAVYWSVALNPYVGKNLQTGNGDISEFFVDPVYEAMLGEKPAPFRGGYSMNVRMQHTLGIRAMSDPTYGGRRALLSRFTAPTRTIFVGMGYFEGMDPDDQGRLADQQLSRTDTTAVPHNRRIGAGADGKGGSSALYLFLDGHVANLTPDEAAVVLKRQ